MNSNLDYTKVIKSKNYYPSDVKKEMELYSLDIDGSARFIGSFSYRSNNSSDVDIFENLQRTGKKNLIDFVIQNLLRISKNITFMPEQYLCEVKFGLDHAFYDIDYGSCQNDIYTVSDEFFSIMANYYSVGLISEKDYGLINEVKLKSNRSQLDFENIKAMLRGHFILRWNYNELMNGYKLLSYPNGEKYKYSIYTAIQDKTQINIEGIFRNYENRYVEISNFFLLQYQDGDEVHMLNLSDKILTDFEREFDQNLKTSMYTLLNSKIAFNPLKACKRFLSYARFFSIEDLLKKSYNIINSPVGKLYNLNSQIKVISKILNTKFNKIVSHLVIYHQLEMIIFDLQSILLSDFDDSKYVEIINSILSQNTEFSYGEVVKMLNDVAHELGDYINNKTISMLKNYGLYPLPKTLYPDVLPF